MIDLPVRTLLVTEARQKGHTYWNVFLEALCAASFGCPALVSRAAVAIPWVSCPCVASGSTRGISWLRGLPSATLFHLAAALSCPAHWRLCLLGLRFQRAPRHFPLPFSVFALCARCCSPTRVLHAALQVVPALLVLSLCGAGSLLPSALLVIFVVVQCFFLRRTLSVVAMSASGSALL